MARAKQRLGEGVEIRQEEWTRSIAVGSRSFIENLKTVFVVRAKGRDVIGGGEGYQLREGPADYQALFGAENEDIPPENAYLWDIKAE